MGCSNPLSSADKNKIAVKMERCFQTAYIEPVLFIVTLGSEKGLCGQVLSGLLGASL